MPIAANLKVRMIGAEPLEDAVGTTHELTHGNRRCELDKRCARNWVAVLALLAMSTLTASAQQTAITIEVHRSPSYGPHLTDGTGRALYLFTNDRQSTATLPPMSQCTDSCTEAWLPLVAYGGVQAAAGARNPLLGRVQRMDGRPQVTYNGWPLYYSVKDPGQPTGHDTHRYGGGWFLVTPQGNRLED